MEEETHTAIASDKEANNNPSGISDCDEKAILGKRRRSSEDAKLGAKRKRRSSKSKPGAKKHRRTASAELKFHLGGSISDPLNLEGLSGSGHDCTTCPPTPPTPSPERQPSPLPPHLRHDPLNLEGTQQPSAADKAKRKRHAKNVKELPVFKDPECSKAKKEPEPVGSGSGVVKETQISSVVVASDKVQEDGAISTSASVKAKTGKGRQFRYGNYTRYYGYRNSGSFASDNRLKLMKKEWFKDKEVLDIGCNTGQVTIEIAKEFCPKRILGLDIDEGLIKTANKNMHRIVAIPVSSEGKEVKFPISFSKVYGPISAPTTPGENKFPTNISFKQENYVPTDETFIDDEKPRYHVILALSLTKWIHLNWGDVGLKRFFKRVYLNLVPGGMFILEPQEFSSYRKKRFLTHEIFQNYSNISFKPEEFSDYLLSAEVGFVECLPLGVPDNGSKGFQRPLELYIKPDDNK